ncbi:MAG: TrbC/VirB2 family protein [Bacteroidales bacterium]|nr:TrbC/VirB2 family protein [Bacteroidales bacterium]
MERLYFKHKARTKRVGIIAGWVVLGIIAAVGFAFLFGYVIMLLWNWLMPMIFGLTEISYWQAVGIIILAKLLFGGFGGHHKYSKSDRDKRPGRHIGTKTFKTGFSKWRHYDKYWKDEGEDSYKRYIEKQNNEVDSDEKSDEVADDNEVKD